jgi:hypothetical protein
MLTSTLIALSLQQSHAFIHLSLKHEVQVPPSPHTDFHKQSIPKGSTSHRTQSLPPNPFTHHSPTTTLPVPFHAHESRHNTPISRSKHSQNFPSMSLSPVRHYSSPISLCSPPTSAPLSASCRRGTVPAQSAPFLSLRYSVYLLFDVRQGTF